LLSELIECYILFAKVSLSLRNQLQDTVVIKGVEGHLRVENERNVLKRFQYRTPYLRPLIDEIQEPSATTIALRYLDSDLWEESNRTKMSRKELKHVSRCILEALKVLHKDGYVHTGRSPYYLFP
jgi:serine/threonine protein kinase